MWPVSQVNLGLRERVHDQLLAWTALLLRPDGWWQICANNVWNSGTCLSFLRFFFSVIKMGVWGVFFFPILIWVSWRDSAWYSPSILATNLERKTDRWILKTVIHVALILCQFDIHIFHVRYIPLFFGGGGGGSFKEHPGGSSGVDMIMLPMIYGMDISEVLEVLVVGCSKRAGSLETNRAALVELPTAL